jgi:hypothetical protein
LLSFVISGGATDLSWTHHVGDSPKPVRADFKLSPEDITWMSRYSRSQIVHLSLTAILTVSSAGKTKTLPTFR